MVRTDWGIFELHASAPLPLVAQRTAAWQELLDSLQLEQPAPSKQQVHPPAAAARQILGSWKSYRGRMRLAGSGRISIVPDSVDLLTAPNSSKVLTGNFHAQGDLLLVTWDDGSLLNFRWRGRGSDLLLTDHEGQISQLKRLYE